MDINNKYIKIWLICFLIITVVYFLCLFIMKDHNLSTYELNNINRTYLKSVTPAYPPPLFNFGDSPQVLQKVFPVDGLT
jgi:hypothetical protein